MLATKFTTPPYKKPGSALPLTPSPPVLKAINMKRPAKLTAKYPLANRCNKRARLKWALCRIERERRWGAGREWGKGKKKTHDWRPYKCKWLGRKGSAALGRRLHLVLQGPYFQNRSTGAFLKLSLCLLLQSVNIRLPFIFFFFLFLFFFLRDESPSGIAFFSPLAIKGATGH